MKFALLLPLLLLPLALAAQEPAQTQFQLPPASVANRASLAHTAQILPSSTKGSVKAQTKDVLNQAEAILKTVQSSLVRAVKLNVYVTSADSANAIGEVITEAFANQKLPALSWVQTALPNTKALVALDVVATSDASSLIRNANVAILPAGRHLYVSGQAENAISLDSCTRLTMQSLLKTLNDCNLTPKDVVQIKAFLHPMSSVQELRREVERLFPGDSPPPLVFVEWISKLPAEIELIAYAGPYKKGLQPMEFITPPGMKASKVFSRVTRVNSERVIYLSGLFGVPQTPAEEQIHLIFDQMKALLTPLGSDLRHLAKATYYVTDDAASEQLGVIRPEYFDPKRPPAASKAMVEGTGVKGCTITLDMIAAGANP